MVFGRSNAGGRKVSRAESHDFINFSRPRRGFQMDAADGRGVQVYGRGISRYEGMYGLPGRPLAPQSPAPRFTNAKNLWGKGVSEARGFL